MRCKGDIYLYDNVPDFHFKVSHTLVSWLDAQIFLRDFLSPSLVVFFSLHLPFFLSSC